MSPNVSRILCARQLSRDTSLLLCEAPHVRDEYESSQVRLYILGSAKCHSKPARMEEINMAHNGSNVTSNDSLQMMPATSKRNRMRAEANKL